METSSWQYPQFDWNAVADSTGLVVTSLIMRKLAAYRRICGRTAEDDHITCSRIRVISELRTRQPRDG